MRLKSSSRPPPRRYLTVARRLSEARRAAAAQFASAIERELADLAMARTRFEVRLERREDPTGWTERGIDAGEFYISPNPGEEVRPLARIVSGGELSRVMLALKTLAAADATSKTLIFDEIDAGIGGRVATVVGDKLRALGTRFQVLCISHLPQIAATASTHFHIEKTVRGARTTTAVARLQDEERIEELARMLAGAAVGESSRATARELLSASQVRDGSQGESERRKSLAGESESRIGSSRRAAKNLACGLRGVVIRRLHKYSMKYFIETYGCQMNVHDSERMAGLLESSGYERAAEDADADLIVINTCSVREKAEEKLYTRLGAIKGVHRATGKAPLVAVTGCVAQQEGERLLERSPFIDVVVGTQRVKMLPMLVKQARGPPRRAGWGRRSARARGRLDALR